MISGNNPPKHWTSIPAVRKRWDLAASLRPSGLMVVNDFVGPSRFQWTDRQLEVISFGGTVFQLLFADIAHHFLSDTGETQKLLELCFAVEDVLIDSGELPSDNVYNFRKSEPPYNPAKPAPLIL